MRIGGLASGMDIDSIVEKLMAAERMPLDRLSQRKQTLEWQRDDYRSMNTLLYDLKNSLSVTQADGIGKQGTFLKKTITSSDESKVTARNITGSYNINTSIRVDQLAEAAYMNSAGDIRSTDPAKVFDPNGKLSAQSVNLLNSASVPTGAFSFTIKAVQSGGTLGPKNADGTIGTKFDFDTTQVSLNDIIAKINSSNAGVSAFYDDKTGRISLQAKNTGDISGSAEIILEETGTTFLTDVLRFHSNNDLSASAGVGKVGKNALVQINGLDTVRTTNAFQVNGFEYTLKGITNTTNPTVTDPGELVTITSQTDVDGIFNSVKSFIDKYNETIDKVNQKLSEAVYRDFKPLTDAQKKEMEEKDIELWEGKAKSGLLKNDSTLATGLSQMRVQMYGSVTDLSGAFYNTAKAKTVTIDSLSNIGITTSSNYMEKGKLIISDEAALKEAIAQNPLAIYDLFNKEEKDSNGKIIYAQSGIATRIEQVITNTMTSIETKAGKTTSVYSQYTLGRLLDRVDRDMISFEDRLKQVEDRYWRQFGAMEQAINKSNSQSAYLMQQFS